MNSNQKPSLSLRARAHLRTQSPVKEIMTFADKNFLAKAGLADREVISFAGGWVNHNAPSEMREAYEQIVMNDSLFHKSGSYTASLGSEEVKTAISKFEHHLYGANVKNNEIAIGLGSTQLAINLFQAILDPGDKIILLDPSYCNYPVQIMSAVDGVEIIRFSVLDIENWKYTAEEKAIEFRNFILKIKPKVVLLISPDNPTSQVLSDTFCSEALNAVEKVNGYLVMDFAYRELIFSDQKPSYFGWGANQNFISICSNSKWCRGLGRRLGWIKANSEVINGLESLFSSTILCADTLHQMAFARYVDIALNRSTLSPYIEKTKKEYMFAAKHMVNGIRNILQVDCFEPKGGLFTCINVKKNSASFVEETLTKTGVLLVPGWGFGNTMQTAVRLSYGPLVNDCNQIDRGIHAMATQFSNRVT